MCKFSKWSLIFYKYNIVYTIYNDDIQYQIIVLFYVIPEQT